MAKLERTVADGAVASGLVSEADLARVRAELGDAVDDQRMLQGLVGRGLLTKWQAAQLKSVRVQNLVLGNYHLLSHLGAGGMGAVFRARDRRLGREVAIKILPPSAATPEAVGRFRREALAALQLRHEHVVASFELAQQGSIHYLVMELVDGPSLAALLDKKKRLSVRESARIGQEVALALEHARQQGIVHRDFRERALENPRASPFLGQRPLSLWRWRLAPTQKRWRRLASTIAWESRSEYFNCPTALGATHR